MSSIEEELEAEREVSRTIQNALNLDEKEVALKELVDTYQWIKTNIIAIITGLGAVIIAIVSYVYYSQDFKEDTKDDINKINTEIETLTKDCKVLQNEMKALEINQANIRNMDYKIESMKEIENLKLDIQKIRSNSTK